ncbi:MAG: gamma-glutamyltransferase, partial [Gammaproteobacteria bacterium]|nr:gamma-glutamyltransferase [Gammaproteobacteria bacterium]
YPPSEPKLEKGDTIYLTVADADGNMVSLIQSNYGDLGSGMTPAELGFQLQNRGQLFSLEEGHANVYEPGKRPFHTIIPAFVMKDGKPWISFGVMGGSMQPQAHAQVIVNLVDFDMNLQEAGDAARMRHVGSSSAMGDVMTSGGAVFLESGIGASVREALRAKGHDIMDRPIKYGGYQAILRDEIKGVYYGASESRKDGQAAGY